MDWGQDVSERSSIIINICRMELIEVVTLVNILKTRERIIRIVNRSRHPKFAKTKEVENGIDNKEA